MPSARSFNVLFVAPTDVSSAVLASGLLKKLHDEAPDPAFTIVATGKVAPLYADMPKVERIIIADKERSGRRWVRPVRRLAGAPLVAGGGHAGRPRHRASQAQGQTAAP